MKLKSRNQGFLSFKRNSGTQTFWLKSPVFPGHHKSGNGSPPCESSSRTMLYCMLILFPNEPP